MNCKIPFTKDIDFEKKVSEITSISLEHEIKTDDDMLKGNFIISGEFKSHEVSVNKEAFSYILPFEIELLEDVDKDTIEFMIEDFTYEIIENSILRVKIDFNVIASLKEVEEKEEEPLFKDARELFLDNEVEEEQIEEPVIPKIEEETIEKEEEVPIEVKEEVREVVKEEPKEEVEPKEEIRKIKPQEVMAKNPQKIEKINEETIINSVASTIEYTTYHIHIVNDGESIDSICAMYNINISILSEYNEMTEITTGDKLIIPQINE